MSDAIINTVTFVEASDIFGPIEMEALAYTDMFSWGDNNRTLISVDRLLEAAKIVGTSHELKKSLGITIIEAIRKIPVDVYYVDMEN